MAQKRTFDEWVVYIGKWLIVIVLYFAISVPCQIVWFFVFGFYKKKRPDSDATIWTPTEKYAAAARKILTDDF